MSKIRQEITIINPFEDNFFHLVICLDENNCYHKKGLSGSCQNCPFIIDHFLTRSEILLIGQMIGQGSHVDVEFKKGKNQKHEEYCID